MSERDQSAGTPTIAILGWQPGHEDTLAQLEAIPGNIAHAQTFDFPVLYKRVAGAYYETVVVRPNSQVLQAMIDAALEVEWAGVKAIATSCGFNALFQRELAAAVSVPVFASSLLQVPMVQRMLKPGQQVGILTADTRYLSEAHLAGVGIGPDVQVCIAGIEDTAEFSRIRGDPTAILDVTKLQSEVVARANDLVAQNSAIGALVLECTDLPPFAAAIRRAVGLPVFDIVTLTRMVYEAVAADRWPHV